MSVKHSDLNGTHVAFKEAVLKQMRSLISLLQCDKMIVGRCICASLVPCASTFNMMLRQHVAFTSHTLILLKNVGMH